MTQFLLSLLFQPRQILIYCLVFFFGSLLFNGTALRLWGLHRDQTRLVSEIEQLKLEKESVLHQIDQASDPYFIERQARERFDLVEDQDLLFVFNE